MNLTINSYISISIINMNPIATDTICNLASSINKISTNNFFKQLQNLPLQTFILSHHNFGRAVNAWSVILALLLSKVPSYKERRVILRNLLDENDENPHVETFEQFIKLLNNHSPVPRLQSESCEYDHVINTFIENMKMIIENNDWIGSCAALGMIEYTYITVSKHIHDYASKFLTDSEIPHYSSHELIDIEHARDLFSIISPFLEKDPAKIMKGLNTGYTVLYEFYNSISHLSS